jgi:deoxycytidine triphosphate deaminase
MGDKTLVDWEIKKMVSEGKLVIENFDEKYIGPISYDMRASEAYYLSPRGTWEPYNLKEQGSIEIDPFERIIVSTYEAVKMPKNIMGRVRLKQRWAVQGLSYVGGSIDPTYEGRLWLVLRNDGLVPVKISYLDPIVSVEWVVLEKECEGVFSTKTFYNYSDLPPEKKPSLPKRKMYTWEVICEQLDSLSELKRSINIITWLFPTLIAIISIVFSIIVVALR